LLFFVDIGLFSQHSEELVNRLLIAAEEGLVAGIGQSRIGNLVRL
jgi:hypothetical protein